MPRLLPSISNGRVTTATVRMPSSLASCATTGAAPVPVPPPMPAVMNSMSAPSIISIRRSRSSSAAHIGIGAGAQALGDVAADLQRSLDLRVLERLRIGVDAHKLHALDPGSHHMRHGIAATAAHTDDLDYSTLAVRVHYFKHGCQLLT